MLIEFDEAPIELPRMEQCDIITIFYDVYYNRFLDDQGYWVNILDLITANDLYLFRLREQSLLITHRSMRNVLVEMNYPDDYWLDKVSLHLEGE